MSNTSSTRPGTRWLPASVVVGALALVGYGSGPGHWFGKSPPPKLNGAPVRRGPLRISVIERGNLKAADSVSLKCEVEGRTTILSLIAEGTHVKTGDLLCELDATPLTDRRFQQDIAVSNAEAAWVKSKETFEIQESQNKSDVAKAEQKLEFARQDIKKHVEGERDSLLSEAKEALALATEDKTRAKDKLDWSEKLVEKGFLTSTEKDADRAALDRAEIQLHKAQRDLDLLERFKLPRAQAELDAALEEAQRELERVRLQAKARLVDFEADVRTNGAKYDLEREKLSKLQAQIDKARIVAPREGMVVYAQTDSDEPPIQEGTTVRERQEILTIPSAAGMIAQAKLHESVLEEVQVGQRCTLRVDALPGRTFEGRVSFVAVLPDQNSWWSNPNLRLYRANIDIQGSSDDMRPGMSCAIEIVVQDVPDTLYVPLQSVFHHKGRNICFVPGEGIDEERAVEVGRHSQQWVEIVSGLALGEVVRLSPPAGFTPEAGASVQEEEPASKDKRPRAEKHAGPAPTEKASH